MIGGVAGGVMNAITGGSFWEGFENGAFMGAIAGIISGGMGFAFTGGIQAVSLTLGQTVSIGGASGAGSQLISDLGDIFIKGENISFGEVLWNMGVSGTLGAAFAGIGFGLSKGFAALKLKFGDGARWSNNNMLNQYDGVKQASEYLKSQGVPRAYRKQILESFNIETIQLQTAGESTYGLRFYGGNANAEGRYLFETFSSLINRQNLALPYEWNSMTGIQQFQVRSGTIMITGQAASQSAFGNQYTGGAIQWFVNSLEDLIKCQ